MAFDRPILVLTEHARQQVRVGRGTRLVNAYLDPILERLLESSTPVVEIQLEALIEEDVGWANLDAGKRFGALSGDRLRRRYSGPDDRDTAGGQTDAMVEAIGRVTAPLDVGVPGGHPFGRPAHGVEPRVGGVHMALLRCELRRGVTVGGGGIGVGHGQCSGIGELSSLPPRSEPHPVLRAGPDP